MESQHEAAINTNIHKQGRDILLLCWESDWYLEAVNALSLGQVVPQFELGFQGTVSIARSTSPMVRPPGSEDQLILLRSLFLAKLSSPEANPGQSCLPPVPLTQLTSPPHIPKEACALLMRASLLIKMVPL